MKLCKILRSILSSGNEESSSTSSSSSSVAVSDVGSQTGSHSSTSYFMTNQKFSSQGTINSFFKTLKTKRRQEKYRKRDEIYREILMKLKTAYLYECVKQIKSDELSMADFAGLKTIGRGGFGTVQVGQLKTTGEVLAIKILKKQTIVDSKLIENVMYEKQLLRSIDFPFIMKAKYHFYDNANLFIVMEYCAGGDLFKLLRIKTTFSEPIIRFYGAQIVLALEFLHSIDIIYRDLKLENILIDGDGNLKLTDFGFSKRVSNLTYSFCGTPDYMAPEMLRKNGYNSSIDWWALGVLLYELGIGKVPFSGKSADEIFIKVLYANEKIPTNFSVKFADLVKNLLMKDPTNRIGCKENGADDIKTHAWFASINWLKLFEKRMSPPYIPTLKSIMDTSNFAEYEEQELSRATHCLHFHEFDEFY